MDGDEDVRDLAAEGARRAAGYLNGLGVALPRAADRDKVERRLIDALLQQLVERDDGGPVGDSRGVEDREAPLGGHLGRVTRHEWLAVRSYPRERHKDALRRALEARRRFVRALEQPAAREVVVFGRVRDPCVELEVGAIDARAVHLDRERRVHLAQLGERAFDIEREPFERRRDGVANRFAVRVVGGLPTARRAPRRPSGSPSAVPRAAPATPL